MAVRTHDQLDELAEPEPFPPASGQGRVYPRPRLDATVKGLAELAHRPRCTQRLICHRLHRRQRVLDPMVELAHGEAQRLLGALMLLDLLLMLLDLLLEPPVGLAQT